MAIGAGAPTSADWADIDMPAFQGAFGLEFDCSPEHHVDGEIFHYADELKHETPATIRARCAGYLEERA